VAQANVLALATLALAGVGAGAQDAPPATPGTSQSPWNTGTAPPQPKPPAEDSTLSLRLYEENFAEGKLPYRQGRPRRDDPAWAVDVSAVMTRCPDGNLMITALVIGGQLTPLDNRCPDDEPAERSAAPECDAKTWNCATTTGK
jgi:hypothetical protein